MDTKVKASDRVEELTSLIDEKIEGPTMFRWQSQLRYYWQEDDREVKISICDFRSMYSYEYHGNQKRLVIVVEIWNRLKFSIELRMPANIIKTKFGC